MTVSSMNKLMEPLWAQAQHEGDHGVLDPRLGELIEGGLALLGGAVLFAKRAPRGYRPAADESLTGLEAGVNKIFLDELVDTKQEGWATKCVVQARLLAEQVLRLSASVTDLPIDVSLSVDLGGPTVVRGEEFETLPSSAFRFYVQRADDRWMSDDLEGFDQPVAVIRAS